VRCVVSLIACLTSVSLDNIPDEVDKTPVVVVSPLVVVMSDDVGLEVVIVVVLVVVVVVVVGDGAKIVNV